MGKIKKLHFNEINGWAQHGTTELYPITSTGAVFNSDNESLDDILAGMQEAISKGMGGGGSEDENLDSINYMWAFCGATDDADALSKLGTQNQEINPPTGWSSNSNVTLKEGEVVYLTTARRLGKKWLVWTSGPDLGKVWSTPCRIGGNTTSTTGIDGDGYNFMYCRTSEEKAPKIPSSLTVEYLERISDLNNFGVDSVSGQVSNSPSGVWYDHPNGVTALYPCEWMVAFKGNDTDGYKLVFPNPVLWSKYGQNGMDGDGFEYIFKLCKSTDNAPTWGSVYLNCRHGESLDSEKQDVEVASLATSEWYQLDDVIPEGWHDDPQDMSASYDVLYVSVRKRKWVTNSNDGTDNGGESKWGPFSTPTKWSTISSIDNLHIVSTITLFSIGRNAEEFGEDYRKETNPSGWESNPNIPTEGEDKDKHLFMITAQTLNGNYVSDDDGNIWSVPMLISYKGTNTDKTGVDVNGVINFIYYRTNSKTNYPPGTPLLNPDELEALWDKEGHDLPVPADGVTLSDDVNAEGWRDHPLGIEENAKYEFFSMSVLRGDTWSKWTAPALWSNWGERGLDGDGVEYIFCLSPVAVTDTSSLIDAGTALGYYTGHSDPEKDDFLPLNPAAGIAIPDVNQYWTDDPKEVSEAYPYQYVSKRKKNQEDGQAKWGLFGKPTLWSRYGRDGVVSGYILTCENDVVILDDQTLAAAVGPAANTKFHLSGEYDTEIYDLGFEIANSSTNQSIIKGTIDNLGNLTYEKKGEFVKDTTVVTIVNALLIDKETGVSSVVATRRHLIQIKDINSTGTVYRVIVTPNSIGVSSDKLVITAFKLNISYIEINAEGTSLNTTAVTKIISSAEDFKSATEDIVATITPANTNSYHSANFLATENVADYYIVNLYCRYVIDASDKKTIPYALVDSETFNCIPAGGPGGKGPAAEYYTMQCDSPSIIRVAATLGRPMSYTPAKVTFNVFHIKGDETPTPVTATIGLTDGVRGSAIPALANTEITVRDVVSATASYLLASYTDSNGIVQTVKVPVGDTATGGLGLLGAVTRYLGNWKTIVGYNDETEKITNAKYFVYNTIPSGDTIAYIDIVSLILADGTTHYYKCKATHSVNSETAVANYIPSAEQWWTKADEYEFIATDVLIANSIKTTTLSAEDVVIVDDDKVIAGMTSSNPSQTALDLGVTSVGSVRIWAGSDGAAGILNAPFRVYNDGKLVSSQFALADPSNSTLNVSDPNECMWLTTYGKARDAVAAALDKPSNTVLADVDASIKSHPECPIILMRFKISGVDHFFVLNPLQFYEGGATTEITPVPKLSCLFKATPSTESVDHLITQYIVNRWEYTDGILKITITNALGESQTHLLVADSKGFPVYLVRFFRKDVMLPLCSQLVLTLLATSDPKYLLLRENGNWTLDNFKNKVIEVMKISGVYDNALKFESVFVYPIYYYTSGTLVHTNTWGVTNKIFKPGNDNGECTDKFIDNSGQSALYTLKTNTRTFNLSVSLIVDFTTGIGSKNAWSIEQYFSEMSGKGDSDAGKYYLYPIASAENGDIALTYISNPNNPYSDGNYGSYT